MTSTFFLSDLDSKKVPFDILVVDDSKSILTFIRSILQREGYAVRACSSGREALAQLSDGTPDLFICDIMMPGMDGYELCRHLRENQMTAHVPIILLTAKDTVKDKVRGLDTGADDYVTKPFKPEELKARVRAQLRMKVLQDRLRENNALLRETQAQLEQKVKELETANEEIVRHQRRLQDALRLAYKVQLELLPQSPPELPGYTFRSRFIPAETIAGDFYDFIRLDERRIGLAIGDVAGKGLAAALVMVLTKTLLRTEAQKLLSPSQLLENLNALLRKHHHAPEAITLFYGVLDTVENSLHFANAGHEFPLAVSKGGGMQVKELGVGGPFLGIFPTVTYNEAKIYLDEGDRLMFFTDGVLHLSYRGNPIRNVETLRNIFRTNRELTLNTFITKLFRCIETGRMGKSYEKDDTTIVLLDVHKPRTSTVLGELMIRNNVRNLSEAREFSQTVLESTGLERGRLFDLVYSVDEAVLNGVLHAYDEGQEGVVRVKYSKPDDADFVEVEIQDDGRGLNPAVLPEKKKILEENLLVPQGRGLVMIESLVDDLTIRKTSSGGAAVVLKKNLE